MKMNTKIHSIEIIINNKSKFTGFAEYQMIPKVNNNLILHENIGFLR